LQYLCTTFGSSGDVFPMLGLALELKRRGHDVTFITNEHFRGLSERLGMRFEPLGTNEQFEAAVNDPNLWNPRKAFKTIFGLLQPALKQQYDTLARYYRPGETVCIANCLSFGANIAQDKLGLPLVTLHLQPGVIWSDAAPPTIPGMFGPRWLRRLFYYAGERFIIDPVVCAFLNPWRQELGLPPVRKITRWWHSPYAVVCMFPEWFCPPAPDWPASDSGRLRG
jgi:UDP:flavonoid glycosyltransferase YjiC (YdhE family)